MDPQVITLVIALLAAGCAAGFTAGMFGIGGGAIMVPVLKYTFEALGYSGDVTMHMAIGTSTSIIIVTALRSAYGHHKKQAVDWDLVWPKNPFKGWGLWIGIGALLAPLIIASSLSGSQLTVLFGCVMVFIALQFIFGRPEWSLAKDVPSGAAAPVVGTGLGGLCALMGIGFGSIGVTLMLLCGRPIHKAIGTAAAIGFFIGAPAALGYMVSGLGEAGRPPFSLGYVNGLGFALMAASTIICVPLGVKAAHKLNQEKLRLIFGICLLALALEMLRKVIF